MSKGTGPVIQRSGGLGFCPEELENEAQEKDWG